jgi:dihydroorotase
MDTERIVIRNARLVNEGQQQTVDVLLEGGMIAKIGEAFSLSAPKVIDGTGKLLLPGVIDGQVHFREPGLTDKADLRSESRAAVAGGVTSFIDMPNTRPNVLSMSLLEDKYRLAEDRSLANFGFFLGVNGENIDEVLSTDTSGLLAVSDDGLYFSGKGNLLADNPDMLRRLFKDCDSIIAIHAEREELIEENEHKYRELYGEDVPVRYHPHIRSVAACFEASQRAVALAQEAGARLHILHLTTKAETALFRNDIPLQQKRITTEVAVQHLWFSEKDYERLGTLIKWNPAIKSEEDRVGLIEALLDDRIDIITTDHAPHTLEEKTKPYFQAMSGAPMVQHALNVMLEFERQGIITLEKVVEKMCHNPAMLYRIDRRGFVREGYYADLVLVDPHAPFTVSKDNIHYKCGWSPLEGTTFRSSVSHTFVNGHMAYESGHFDERIKGRPLVVRQDEPIC